MSTEALAGMGTIIAAILSPSSIVLTPDLSQLALVGRWVGAMLLLFFAPGFALVRATLVENIPGLWVFVLSLGLSVALTIVAGILLDTAGHLNPQALVIALASVTIFAAVVAKRLGRRLLPRIPRPVRGFGKADTMMVCLALVLATAGVLVARRGAEHHREFTFTQFWMLPVSDWDSTLATLGIANHEGVTTRYDVDILIDGRLIERRTGIEIRNGGEHIAELMLPLRPSQKAEAWLFKNGNHREVYRTVWLWSRPAGAPPPAEADPPAILSAATGESSPETRERP